MGALWNAVSPWLNAIGFVISLSIIVITFRFLHDTDERRRFWRNVILWGSTASALVSLGQAVSNKQLRDTVAHWVSVSSELQGRVNAGDQALADLKAADAKSLSDLRAQIAAANRKHENETVAIRGNLAGANIEISQAKRQSDAVNRFAHNVASRSQAFATEIRYTLAGVQRSDARTRSLVFDSLDLSRAAAEKAGVYRVPDAALRALTADLQRSPAGSATITCATNLVATCAQLASAFEQVGWKAIQLPGVLPYPVGVLDAVPDPNPSTGLIVFYDPSLLALGRAIATDLADSGFTVEARALAAGPFGAEIGIAVRFLSR